MKNPVVAKSKAPSRREVVRAANDQARQALAASSVSASASGHLGDLVWWDLVSGWRGNVDDVAKVFAKHGLEPVATLPESPDWPIAFGRAVQSIRTSVGADGFTLWDLDDGPNGERRVSILRKNANVSAKPEQVGVVACPKKGEGSPYVEASDPAGIADRIVAESRDYYGVFISDDVRAGVTTLLLRFSAMPCRQAPPHIVYWLPAAGGEHIRKVADAVEELGWGRVELFAGYVKDERSARACVAAVNNGLEARLSEFAAEVASYAERDPKKTRPSTIESKMADAKRLREQADLYRTILGAAVVGIDSRVAKVEQTLLETLGIVESAHAA